MFHYHAKTFHSATIGKRFKPVRCDNCGCEFCYELTRIGWGTGTAPYGLGAAAAQRSSVEKSQRDLAGRLNSEAEMVPCPKCNWVNDELTLGFRNGRYRGLGTLAVCGAIAGTVVSFVCAYYLSKDAPANRGTARYLLTIGPGISLAFALFVTGLRNLLRGRIRPNDTHPQPPKLPIGSPRPQILSPTTGQLEFAARPAVGAKTTDEAADEAAGNWVYFLIGRDRLPPVCCECLAPVGPAAGFRQRLLTAIALAIPRCQSCTGRWKRRKWQIGLTAFTIALAVMIGVLAAIRKPHTEFWLLVGAAGLIAACIAGVTVHYTAAPVRVKAVDRPRGVVRLWFRNGQYARQTAAASENAKIVA